MSTNYYIKRTIDELGRITLPKDIRNALNVREREKLIIMLDCENDQVIITPEKNMCKLCNTKTDDLSDIGLCIDCIEKTVTSHEAKENSLK